MMRKRTVFGFVFLLVICAAGARNVQPDRSAMQVRYDDKTQLPPAYVPPGLQMYKEYCAACHGSDGKGHGPVAASLRKPPPNLTILARRQGGTFPEEYVTNVLRFGPGFSAHGSSEMPVWGPLFQYLENYNEAAVRQRIKNLCDYLESIQEK
jgi:mono/diheme cytochrome c family protein